LARRDADRRARLEGEDGKTREWRSGSPFADQRRTRAADALIAGGYLSGADTRRAGRKDVVSRVWRKATGNVLSLWTGAELGPHIPDRPIN
jgi:hypothetical protein